jgi:hypothetical protein
VIRENIPGKGNGIAKVQEKILKVCLETEKEFNLDGIQFVFGTLEDEST